MVILNIGEIYLLNSMAKALFKAGLQDALLKYSLTVNEPSSIKAQYGINGELMWVNRSPDIEERTQGDVLHLCGAEYWRKIEQFPQRLRLGLNRGQATTSTRVEQYINFLAFSARAMSS